MFRGVSLALLVLTLFCGQALAAEKYTVASDCTWPPMEMLNAQKQPEGYSTDYIRAVAKAAGFEVDVRNIAWDGIFGGVATGKYDIVASSTTITPERQKQFDFSDPYYEVVQAVVLPAGTSIKSLADLKGKKVGGQIGTTGIFVMRKADVDADLKEYDDVGLAIQDMVGGHVLCEQKSRLRRQAEPFLQDRRQGILRLHRAQGPPGSGGQAEQGHQAGQGIRPGSPAD